MLDKAWLYQESSPFMGVEPYGEFFPQVLPPDPPNCKWICNSSRSADAVCSTHWWVYERSKDGNTWQHARKDLCHTYRRGLLCKNIPGIFCGNARWPSFENLNSAFQQTAKPFMGVEPYGEFFPQVLPPYPPNCKWICNFSISADPVCTHWWVYERSKDGNTWRHGPQEGKISVTPIEGVCFVKTSLGYSAGMPGDRHSKIWIRPSYG